MGVLEKLKSRLGPSQTDHKRLAEIKLTQERLNKEKTNTPNYVQLETPEERPLGGGSMDLIGGRGLARGVFNLSKKIQSLRIKPLDIVMNASQTEETE
tara:strand:+ start:654 stop:947 length:294 start_codon:yes stop_codon:yes gene_type:complete